MPQATNDANKQRVCGPRHSRLCPTQAPRFTACTYTVPGPGSLYFELPNGA